MKTKLIKNKQKLTTNISNFSNPFNSKLQKIHLETSTNAQGIYFYKKFSRRKKSINEV
jgi:hypothetical protein